MRPGVLTEWNHLYCMCRKRLVLKAHPVGVVVPVHDELGDGGTRETKEGPRSPHTDGVLEQQGGKDGPRDAGQQIHDTGLGCRSRGKGGRGGGGKE